MPELATLAPLLEADLSPQDQRRSQILDAARRCFAQHGFRGASMHQVCAEAKMSPGALYRYFPSKESIIEAISEDERRKAGAVMALFHAETTLLGALIAGAMGYLTIMREPLARQLNVEICAESLRNSTIGARFQCMEDDVRSAILAAFEVARHRGEMAPDADPVMVLSMMMSIVDGLVMRMGLEEWLTPETAEPYLRRLFAALLDAPAPGSGCPGAPDRGSVPITPN